MCEGESVNSNGVTEVEEPSPKLLRRLRACPGVKWSLAAPAKCENTFSLVPVPAMGVSGMTISTGGDHPAKIVSFHCCNRAMHARLLIGLVCIQIIEKDNNNDSITTHLQALTICGAGKVIVGEAFFIFNHVHGGHANSVAAVADGAGGWMALTQALTTPVKATSTFGNTTEFLCSRTPPLSPTLAKEVTCNLGRSLFRRQTGSKADAIDAQGDKGAETIMVVGSRDVPWSTDGQRVEGDADSINAPWSTDRQATPWREKVAAQEYDEARAYTRYTQELGGVERRKRLRRLPRGAKRRMGIHGNRGRVCVKGLSPRTSAARSETETVVGNNRALFRATRNFTEVAALVGCKSMSNIPKTSYGSVQRAREVRLSAGMQRALQGRVCVEELMPRASAMRPGGGAVDYMEPCSVAWLHVVGNGRARFCATRNFAQVAALGMQGMSYTELVNREKGNPKIRRELSGIVGKSSTHRVRESKEAHRKTLSKHGGSGKARASAEESRKAREEHSLYQLVVGMGVGVSGKEGVNRRFIGLAEF
ncbi:hypothetical protein EDB83DRAFT_2316688 [Lactarius deliciosus]|nr:hypothetical protein EDB83DRAFT_2316688 [Lactarius deliciosus]